MTDVLVLVLRSSWSGNDEGSAETAPFTSARSRFVPPGRTRMRREFSGTHLQGVIPSCQGFLLFRGKQERFNSDIRLIAVQVWPCSKLSTRRNDLRAITIIKGAQQQIQKELQTCSGINLSCRALQPKKCTSTLLKPVYQSNHRLE